MANRATTRAARALLFLACCAAAGEARADSIAPRPACPPGSLGRSSHAGQWCAAAPCTADSDCKRKGDTCKKWRVCEQAAMATHGRMARKASRMTLVVGACAPADRCKGDEVPPPPVVGQKVDEVTCTTGQYCVPASLPALPAPAPAKDEEDDEERDDEASGAAKRSRPKTGDGCGCRSRGAAAQGGASVVLALGLLLMVRRRS